MYSCQFNFAYMYFRKIFLKKSIRYSTFVKITTERKKKNVSYASVVFVFKIDYKYLNVNIFLSYGIFFFKITKNKKKLSILKTLMHDPRSLFKTITC